MHLYSCLILRPFIFFAVLLVVLQVQKLVNNWLVVTSFSIGVADTVADTETIMTIGGIIDTAKRCAMRYDGDMVWYRMASYGVVCYICLYGMPVAPVD